MPRPVTDKEVRFQPFLFEISPFVRTLWPAGVSRDRKSVAYAKNEGLASFGY